MEKRSRRYQKKEYYIAKTRVIRGFSGHWMLFYAVSIVMLAGVAELRRRRLAGEPLEPNKNGKPDIETEPETVSSGESVVARAARGELDLDAETAKCDEALGEAKQPPHLKIE